MKALVLEEYKKFICKDVPTPVPGEGEVLVRVKACAVCGSDVHGKVNVDALISKAVPLSDGNEWINRVYAREPGLNKIVLIP